ncbi:hypothetical protein GCK72_013154 [Caenorhabditis remanei]|uniref:Uncharacterized protein n=1 Tax=Caenorhabditis remanei TaxID=31234 RepID=A0A6A5GN57_CAERE|nr:hypothetical protein GCK72_013154 [Caenorhabditis remanei]KAF1756700.1 hypothetical protein GCK72_013154 [Caenorhabditis remanei]
MLGLLVFGLIAHVQTAPVGPNYDNIQYLHNFTLTYANNSLEGMGAIDNLTDVNPQMAQNLKSAINLALPGYLASSRTSSSTPSSSTSSVYTSGASSTSTGSTGSSGSSAMPMASTTTSMPGRKRRAADPTSTTYPGVMATTTPSIFRDPASSSASSSTPSFLQPSTTQPYGTDEEFYARTDLVHFHVDINDLEGSGAI